MNLNPDLKEQIDKIVDKHTGTTLWLEAIRIAVKNNPRIAREVLLTIRDNRDIRASLSNISATNKTKTAQLATRVPRSIQDILEIVDPDTFPINNPKDMKKFMKTFPEFTIPENAI